jgi:hypothetical protein
MRPPFARRFLPWSIASLVIAASHGCRRRGEFVEDEQRIVVLGDASGGFLVFQLVTFNEGGRGLGPRLGHPDLLEGALGFPLLTLRKLVEEVGGLVS